MESIEDNGNEGHPDRRQLEERIAVDEKTVLRDQDQLAHDVNKLEHDVEELEHERHRGLIKFFVDGEDFKTHQHEFTPNAIISDFGGLAPASHYLVKIGGGAKESFQGKGDIPIHIHEGERFQIISIGPTPVADAVPLIGTAAFKQGLQGLGYEPIDILGAPDQIVFQYQVQSGAFANKVVRLGLIVPQNFPLNPPSALHVSPNIHSPMQGGTHPKGGIHPCGLYGFRPADPANWQCWSRPCPDWQISKKTVATYMNYVWRLWDTQ